MKSWYHRILSSDGVYPRLKMLDIIFGARFAHMNLELLKMFLAPKD